MWKNTNCYIKITVLIHVTLNNDKGIEILEVELSADYVPVRGQYYSEKNAS